MTNYREQRHYQREPTLGELFSDLSSQASTLVRQEVRLAKTELTNKAVFASRETAYLVAGALLGYAALLCLLAAIIVGLEAWMPLWVSALIVGAAVAVIAAGLAWKGYSALKRINPAPTRTIATLQEDKEWLSKQMN